MHDLFTTGYENIWGFDASESGVKIAKEGFADIQDRFAVHCAYDKRLPFQYLQEYDIVLSVEVIEHVLYPKVYLENIHGWLKKSGYLILTTPYHGYLKNLTIAFLGKFDRHVNPLWEGGHIKFFSQKTIANILRESGFDYIKFYGSGRLPYLWKSMIVVARKI